MWILHYHGHKWTEDDLTGEDLAALAVLLGDSWGQMNPVNGPLALLSFVTVLEARTCTREMQDVANELQAMKATDIVNILEITD